MLAKSRKKVGYFTLDKLMAKEIPWGRETRRTTKGGETSATIRTTEHRGLFWRTEASCCCRLEAVT